VIHAGSPGEPALGDYLALGATRIEVVPVPAGAGVLDQLAACLGNTDLILTGCGAEQGAGSGVLPYVLARSLGRPIAANVLEATVAGGELWVRQFLPKGRRRSLAVGLPVVLTVHPLAPVKLAYAHAGRVSGSIEAVPSAAHTLAQPAAAPSAWTIAPGTRQPVRLKAEERKPAHARLEAAISVQPKGGVVVIEGSHVDKAQVVLRYLREHRLVDF
jgi:electron transfer flavoprotein beta subunit